MLFVATDVSAWTAMESLLHFLQRGKDLRRQLVNSSGRTALRLSSRQHAPWEGKEVSQSLWSLVRPLWWFTLVSYTSGTCDVVPPPVVISLHPPGVWTHEGLGMWRLVSVCRGLTLSSPAATWAEALTQDNQSH